MMPDFVNLLNYAKFKLCFPCLVATSYHDFMRKSRERLFWRWETWTHYCPTDPLLKITKWPVISTFKQFRMDQNTHYAPMYQFAH